MALCLRTLGPGHCPRLEVAHSKPGWGDLLQPLGSSPPPMAGLPLTPIFTAGSHLSQPVRLLSLKERCAGCWASATQVPFLAHLLLPEETGKKACAPTHLPSCAQDRSPELSSSPEDKDTSFTASTMRPNPRTPSAPPALAAAPGWSPPDPIQGKDRGPSQAKGPPSSALHACHLLICGGPRLTFSSPPLPLS